MPSSSTAIRLFRLLLRLYPRAYRERYGPEMEQLFRQERAAAGGRGPGFWVHQLLDHGEAAWAVRRRKGGEEMRERWTSWTDDMASAWRSLTRAPAFALFAVGTLALGVGATAAVFTVVERVVIRPLPYPASERMALVGIEARLDPGSLGPLSPALLARLRDTPGPAEAVVAAHGRGSILRGEGDPERVELTAVSPGFLGFFGAGTAVGRLLGPADHQEGAPPVVVLGHGAWLERFGADPGVVGRSLRFGEEVRTVVGVLEEGFLPPPELVEEAAFWVPMARPDADPAVSGRFFLGGAARLRPGATLEELGAHADAMVEEVYGGGGPRFLAGAMVHDLHEAVAGPVAGTLGRVLAAVSLLLLISCVNVAGLLLTRGAEREHELAVRSALGAPRRRLVRKLLGESVLLALAGGVMGAGMAWAAVELFRAWAPANLPRLAEVALDERGLAFALALSGVTVLLSGLLPALRTTRGLGHAWASRRGAGPGRGAHRLRSVLVVVETGLAVVLAVGSGLLAHDLARLAGEEAGFRSQGLAVVSLDLRPRYEREEWAGVWERLMEEAQALPEASSVAVATQAPYDGSRMASTYRPEGREEEDAVFTITVAVGGDYLDALGTRLLAGRALVPGDAEGEPGVLVNESFVRSYWSGESAVGRAVHSGEPDEPVYRVVGVLEDVRTRPGQEVAPHVFRPLREAAWREMELLVRTDGDAAALAPGLREAVRRVDPGLPVSRIRTVEAMARQALAPPRFYAGLFGGFTLVALLLAAVGVYGTTAYATRARLREMGIRLALGARRRQVVAAVVGRAGGTVALGVAVGLATAAAASRALTGSLSYVDPRDVPTYLVVGTVVAAAGVLAAWIPAGAAGRADPAETLREE